MQARSSSQRNNAGLRARILAHPTAPDGDALRRTLLAAHTTHAVSAAARAGTEGYRREAVLPRLIPVGPSEVGDCTAAGRLELVKRLARALRGERVRGLAGHWSYSLNRHIGLVQALAAERTALSVLLASGRRDLRG